MSYRVAIRDLEGIAGVHTEVSAINFINPGTHGDPATLLARAAVDADEGVGCYPGEPVLYVNTATITSALITEEEKQ